MEHILINTYKHFSLHEKEWSAILEANENINPFLEYEYVYNWWTSLEVGRKVEIHAVKDNNRVIAFFPFEVKKTGGVHVFFFLTLFENQVMDLIVKKSDASRTIMFLFDSIINERKQIVFQLNELKERGKTFLKLSEYLVARNIKAKDVNKKLKMIYDELPNLETPGDNQSYSYKHDGISLIFSTNTVRSLLYRNFLWVKEVYFSRKS
ncbi:hypothetical protein [Psychrobacillus sp. FSL K6-1415]|uniref:hypothetical protein n=1 Tax=Psychrobacillus sp. FSL K6-1415 TaxID=2921544 RepID=UPI0030F7C8B1